MKTLVALRPKLLTCRILPHADASILRGLGADPAINSAGAMPDGRAFQDSVAFKQLLIADRDAVASAFIEHLCTYALRRVLTFDDKEDLQAIVAEAKTHDYRIKDIVRAVALSDLMRKR